MPPETPSLPAVSVIEEPPVSDQTPLPPFILQFQGMDWFDKLFPNANPWVGLLLLLSICSNTLWMPVP